jgi:spectinomycin phosphotransferase
MDQNRQPPFGLVANAKGGKALFEKQETDNRVLKKPDIKDETIIACIQASYGLPITQIAFLPLGGDLSTAVYRAAAADGTAYFCKLRRGDFDEITVDLPRFFSEQGIAQIIPPLVTTTGRLWAEVEDFRLILYPFVDGKSGFEVELTEGQWAAFGQALRRIHTTRLPAGLSKRIPKERYSSEWRGICRGILRRLEVETFADPITTRLAEYLRPRRETVLDLLERAERLARALAARPTEEVLCHSDIHPGNLHIDTRGALFIVDWDYPMLAPKERDLMFVGGGQGYVARTAEEEERLFYRSYGQAPVDPLAMAYYRCERNIIDLSVEARRIFTSSLNDQDRAQSYEIITWLFGPGGSVEMAYKAAGALQ